MGERPADEDLGSVRVYFRRLAALGWAYAAGLAVAGLAAWTVATAKPSPQPALMITATVVLWLFLGLVRFRRPTELVGTTVFIRALGWTRTIDLTIAREIRLNRSWNGGTHLVVLPVKGRKAYLLLSIWNDISHRGLTVDELHALIRVLDSLRGNQIVGDVQPRLKAQAEHLRNGGSLRNSPLLQK